MSPRPNATDDLQPAPDARAAAPSFDQIIEQLQRIVEQLEREEMPLERSLQAFERGVALSRAGQEILDQAEQRIAVLLRDGATTEPFTEGPVTQGALGSPAAPGRAAAQPAKPFGDDA